MAVISTWRRLRWAVVLLIGVVGPAHAAMAGQPVDAEVELVFARQLTLDESYRWEMRSDRPLVSAGWLVARSGSLERRRDCIAGAGIVCWTMRQSWPQRRAGVATLIAATAAGVKQYQVIDVPVELAWSVAASASPWVARNRWSRRSTR